MDLPKLLRAEGLEVLVNDGWRSNDRPGAFTPIGVMAHHTVAPKGTGEFPSLGTVVKGRPPPRRLRGPLCNVLIGRPLRGAELARVFVISDGRANDSGTGNRSVLDRLRDGKPPAGDATRNGDTDGNRWFWDVEVENDGVGEPYPAAQIESLIRCVAAIGRSEAWPADAHWAIHHREWTSRKIDMSWGGDLRGRVAAYLKGEGIMPEEADRIIKAVTKHVSEVARLGWRHEAPSGGTSPTHRPFSQLTIAKALDAQATALGHVAGDVAELKSQLAKLEQAGPAAVSLSPDQVAAVASMVAERLAGQLGRPDA